MPDIDIPLRTLDVVGFPPIAVLARTPVFEVASPRPEFLAETYLPTSQIRFVIDGPLDLVQVDDSGDTLVTFTPDVDLPDGDYTWYVQRWNGTTWADDSNIREFSVDTSGTVWSAEVEGSLSISTDAPELHLWFADPPTGVEGDTVVLYGHGYTSTVAVTLAGYSAGTVARTVHSASADAYTADRQINPLTGTVDPQHHTATITVPDVPLPGGTLAVEQV